VILADMTKSKKEPGSHIHPALLWENVEMNKCLVVKLLPGTDRNCFLDLTVVSMVLTAEIKELQQAVKEDYDNRELIDKLTLSLRQMTEFINKFGKIV
jgi:hypothetical protein